MCEVKKCRHGAPQQEDRQARGLNAARALARWELGDDYWADRLIGAYQEPEKALEALRRAKEDRDE